MNTDSVGFVDDFDASYSQDTFGDPKTGVQSPELLAIEGDDWTTPEAKASAKSLGSFCPGHGGCCPAFLHERDIGANVLYNCGAFLNSTTFTTTTTIAHPMTLQTRLISLS